MENGIWQKGKRVGVYATAGSEAHPLRPTWVIQTQLSLMLDKVLKLLKPAEL